MSEVRNTNEIAQSGAVVVFPPDQLSILDCTISITGNTAKKYISAGDWRGPPVFFTMLDPRTDIGPLNSGILWDPNRTSLDHFLVEPAFNNGGGLTDYTIDTMNVDFTPCQISLGIEHGTGFLYVSVIGHTGNPADNGTVRVLAFSLESIQTFVII